MIDPDEALRLVLQSVGTPHTEQVSLDEACGRVLAEAIRADRDYPPFPRAMMDGYAVRIAQAGSTVEVVGEIAAGRVMRKGDLGIWGSRDFESPNPETSKPPNLQIPKSPNPLLPLQQCLEIMTGAPCPPGTEAVVPKEQVRRDGSMVTLPQDITMGQHIALQGTECAAGCVVLRSGELLTSLAVAVLAAFGRETVEVARRPSLAVITTGAELAPPGREPGPGQIRDSNGPMLAAMARQMAVEPPLLLHADDDLEAIHQSLDQAAAKDFVLLTGGVSAGKFDLVPAALERYGAELLFRRVVQKPGKPFLLAHKGRQLLFGLPGNPLSCHLVFHRYVAAAIRRFQGKSPAPATLVGQLAAPIRAKGERTHFLLARAERKRGQNYFPAPLTRQSVESPGKNSSDPFFAGWQVHPLRAASSADIFAPAGANCYLRVAPGQVEIAAGEPIEFEWINGIADGTF